MGTGPTQGCDFHGPVALLLRDEEGPEHDDDEMAGRIDIIG